MGNARSRGGSEPGRGSSADVPHLPKGRVLTYEATRASDSQAVTLHLQMVSELGTGAFGVVNKMLVQEEDGDPIMAAVKIPGEDGSLAEIETFLLAQISHTNVVSLYYYIQGFEESPNVSLVIELVDGSDLFHWMKRNYSGKRGLGLFFEVFSYQMFRALAYIHSKKIAHRDIKPENALIDPVTGVLKLADFGCGAELTEPEAKHTAYIGTRIFRAPELLLGAERYTVKVDIWSAAVVMTEMALGVPLFYGGKGQKGHLLNIFEYRGLPTDEDFADMGLKRIPLPRYVPEKSIEHRLRMAPPTTSKGLLLHLLEDMLLFSPEDRLSAWEVCNHDVFKVLASETSLPNGSPMPPLYDFSGEELNSMPPNVRANLERRMQAQYDRM